MKTLVSEFSQFWPPERKAALEALVSHVQFFYYPDHLEEIRRCRAPADIIIVMNEGTTKEAAHLISAGFCHIVHKNRKDFNQELLIAALMLARPNSFVASPLTFFLAEGGSKSKETEFIATFNRSAEKTVVISKLSTFLEKNKALSGVSDLAIQIVDEMISNVLFGAAVDEKGVKINENLDRKTRVELPPHRRAAIFASYTDYRLMIGCEDQFGSIDKDKIMKLFADTISPNRAAPQSSSSAGAGLGVRFMIENSANFYMYCDKGRSSVVACGLLLGSLKANSTAQKNFHLNFR